jgi:DNA-binding NarL/FixJ family response regulator
VAGLSAREAEIIALVARGRTNKEVADELVLSVRTVERHLHNVYGKLGVSGPSARAAAAATLART